MPNQSNDLMNSDRYFVARRLQCLRRRAAGSRQSRADISRWATMSLLNTARSGKFSSDRTIREYCEDIWKLPLGDRQPQPQRWSLQKSTVKVEGDGRGERARCAARHTLCNPHLE